MSAAEPPIPPGRLNRILSHPAVHIGAPLLIAGLGIYVLHDLASHVSWAEVKADIVKAGWGQIGLAVMFTIVSFIGIAFYDVLAVRNTAPGEIPMSVAAATGASGYAVSNMMGFSYLTGTAVRYRIYNSFGVDAGRVAVIFGTSWVAFWLGLTTVIGVLFVMHPVGLRSVFDIDQGVEVGIGIALLAMLAAVLIWLSKGGRKVSIGNFSFDLPSSRMAIGLGAADVLDILGAALTLYILMPSDLVQSFPYFFAIYVGAIALGIISHSPGGLGVFEATMIAGLGASGRSDALAALLLYRLIYTFMPFAVACLGLAAAYGLTKRHHVTASANWVYKIARPLVPPATAGLSLFAGLILLISGSMPSGTGRVDAVAKVLPLSFVEASHLAASVVGLLLIVLSRGLYKRLYRAWLASIWLMAAGIVLSLTKGLDWESALVIAVLMGILWLFRAAFYRVGHSSILRLNAGWLASIVALVGLVIWVGLFAHSHVAYHNALWLDFSASADASRFLRASLAVALVLAAVTVDSLLFTHRDQIGPQPIPEVVRKLVAESEDTDSNLALTGDKAFVISEDETAFLAFADTGTSLIAKGDPVGNEAAGIQTIWQFREMADRMGRRCAFYSVSPKFVPTYLDMGMAILKIGEVARVDLTGFTMDGRAKKGFRAARSRASRDGYVFEVVRKENLGPIVEELRAISDAWLATKQGEEKAFALGAFTDDYVLNYDFAILKHEETGEIVAFTNLYEGANKAELSLDLMRYKPDAPGFAMNALFVEMLVWAAEQGFHWFSLGPSPFSGIENRQLASIWNRIGGFVYEHGEHFYHFEGLRNFKEKFDPVWTPNYMASQGGLSVPRILYEVNVLISGGIKGLMK